MISKREKKDPILAYALWCLSMVGICGVHRMYLGQTGYGLIMLFTFGFLGIGQLLDLFLIPGAVKHANLSIINEEASASDASPGKITSSQSLKQSSNHDLPSVDAKQDDELEMLLSEAKESIERSHKAMREE